MEPANRLPQRVFAKTMVLKTVVVAAILAGLMAAPAMAAPRHHRAAKPVAARGRITPMPGSATDPEKDAALIVDGSNGRVLYARNETLERHPASLTKMMTLYLLFEALKQGKVNMQTQMPVSLHAEKQGPTKLYLRHGQTIDVDTAIRAIVIRSANDVAVAIAESLGGTESHFADLMNEKARQLGMKETNYHNASGLPDPLQITTATDLAVLARHLAYDFPQYFPYFGTTGFTYKGVYYPTHDNLVGRYPGADGIKTGYVGASGFNLATSVVRDGVHLIGIVMGGRTAVRRDLEMMHLMDVEFTDIAANPGMVAHANVPWQAVASATPPALAGFSVAPPSGGYTVSQMAALSAPPPPMLSAIPSPLPADTDEDAAEAHRAPDENFAVIHAEAPALASAAIAPRPMPAQNAPAVPPLAKSVPKTPAIAAPAAAPPPLVAAAKPAPKPQQVAMATPAPRPQQPATALRPEIVADQAQPGRNWTIQIGAFGNQAMAQAQLTSFTAKAKDIIGEAGGIVAPITTRGKTLYRARFGPYGERDARNVCSQLTQRMGAQACLPVVAR